MGDGLWARLMFGAGGIRRWWGPFQYSCFSDDGVSFLPLRQALIMEFFFLFGREMLFFGEVGLPMENAGCKMASSNCRVMSTGCWGINFWVFYCGKRTAGIVCWWGLSHLLR